jgi:uncharacterized protein YfiM (DUF2279 family)
MHKTKGVAMKYFLTTLLTLLVSTSVFAAPEDIQTDKQLHFGVSMGLSAMTYQTMDAYGFSKTKSTLGSLGVALTAGLAKEISDSQDPNNRFDNNDMAYNVLGAVTGTFLHWTF